MYNTKCDVASTSFDGGSTIFLFIRQILVYHNVSFVNQKNRTRLISPKDY